MADKKQWTSDEDNEKLAIHYLNEAYSSGVVDNFMDPYNESDGKETLDKDEEVKH